jgi:hypothetical protein
MHRAGWIRMQGKGQTRRVGDPEINRTPYTAKLVSDGHGRYRGMQRPISHLFPLMVI